MNGEHREEPLLISPSLLLPSLPAPPRTNLLPNYEVFRRGSNGTRNAGNNCNVEEYDRQINNNDGHHFWFRCDIQIIDSSMPKRHYRHAVGSHRWHQKAAPRKLDNCSRTVFYLAHGSKKCNASNREFRLYEYRFSNSTTAIYLLKRNLIALANPKHAPIQTGPGLQPTAVETINQLHSAAAALNYPQGHITRWTVAVAHGFSQPADKAITMQSKGPFHPSNKYINSNDTEGQIASQGAFAANNIPSVAGFQNRYLPAGCGDAEALGFSQAADRTITMPAIRSFLPNNQYIDFNAAAGAIVSQQGTFATNNIQSDDTYVSFPATGDEGSAHPVLMVPHESTSPADCNYPSPIFSDGNGDIGVLALADDYILPENGTEHEAAYERQERLWEFNDGQVVKILRE